VRTTQLEKDPRRTESREVTSKVVVNKCIHETYVEDSSNGKPYAILVSQYALNIKLAFTHSNQRNSHEEELTNSGSPGAFATARTSIVAVASGRQAYRPCQESRMLSKVKLSASLIP
jgi:hypothetical protein